MGDRLLSCKCKGKMLNSCVTPAYMYGLVNMALTQEKVQVCQNRLVDNRKYGQTERGMKNSFKKKLVRSRLKWASYVEKMGDEKLAKRADTQKAEGKGGKEHQDCDGKNSFFSAQTVQNRPTPRTRRPSKTAQ